jgi:hypothetical protein
MRGRAHPSGPALRPPSGLQKGQAGGATVGDQRVMGLCLIVLVIALIGLGNGSAPASTSSAVAKQCLGGSEAEPGLIFDVAGAALPLGRLLLWLAA